MNNYVCVFCEKKVPINAHFREVNNDENPKHTIWPEDGGVIQLDFPFGSRFDTGGYFNPEPYRWYGVMCDDCFEKKQSLFWKVFRQRPESYESLD